MNLYRNQQWAVTDQGIHSVTPEAPYVYRIEAVGLLHEAGKYYAWPLQISEQQGWADMDLFEQAFREAVRLLSGKYRGEVDLDRLKATFEQARRIRTGRD
jgi:hypothetical protein